MQPVVTLCKLLQCCQKNTKSKYILLSATSFYSSNCVSWQWKASDGGHQRFKNPLPIVNF